jgi:hypothetical protein
VARDQRLSGVDRLKLRRRISRHFPRGGSAGRVIRFKIANDPSATVKINEDRKGTWPMRAISARRHLAGGPGDRAIPHGPNGFGSSLSREEREEGDKRLPSFLDGEFVHGRGADRRDLFGESLGLWIKRHREFSYDGDIRLASTAVCRSAYGNQGITGAFPGPARASPRPLPAEEGESRPELSGVLAGCRVPPDYGIALMSWPKVAARSR